jgi:hypothetical protein
VGDALSLAYRERLHVHNRLADLWRPLFAVARVAGPAWVARMEMALAPYVSLSSIEVETQEARYDRLIQQALRRGWLTADDYAARGKAPVEVKKYGYTLDDFCADGRRQAAKLTLKLDPASNSAELRWLASETQNVVAQMARVIGPTAELSPTVVRKEWMRSGRLRGQKDGNGSRSTTPDYLYKGDRRQRLVILDISNWPAWKWNTNPN